MAGKLRLLGLAVMVFVLVFAAARPQPVVLIEATAGNVALRNADGRLAFATARRARFAAERWLRDDGDTASLKDAAARPGWNCTKSDCRAVLAHRKLIYLMAEAAVPTDCGAFDLVIARFPLRDQCRQASMRIDRFDVWRNGSYAIYRTGNDWRITTARQVLGTRPWVNKPVARKHVLVPPQPEPHGTD